ncbi:MAG: hypothetical protein ACXW30_05990 [Micavibrio sp.]
MAELHVYNNVFNEFHGKTPDEVIQAVYQESRAHTGASYDEWWSYQQDIWRRSYDAHIPDSQANGACEVLLKVLLDVGALEEGPKPVANLSHYQPG